MLINADPYKILRALYDMIEEQENVEIEFKLIKKSDLQEEKEEKKAI